MATDTLTPAAELAGRRDPAFPGESAEYGKAREALLTAEIEAHTPRVAKHPKHAVDEQPVVRRPAARV